ncbi:MAG TPA: HEAT repeat domain-containing protein [Pyrinomonadaceae bacterium]
MKKELRLPVLRILGVILTTLFLSLSATQAQNASNQKLERAIGALRRVDPEKLSDSEQEKKAKEINDAWEVIKKAGAAGISRLKEEVRRVDDAKERDDYFKLNATALLWYIAQLNEAEAIAAIWNKTPLRAQYNYVFYTAFDAATRQDPRALPMLEAVLKDKEGEVFFELHAMEVKWPLTHEFIWGAYGTKGLPALAKILETSQDTVELASAILLLTSAQYLPALPRIRELAATGKGEARLVAIQSLGVFGHPQDYDFLISGLRSDDAEVVWRHVYALYEFGDLRAVPLLIPLLKTKDPKLELETLATLNHLLTPASVEALQQYSQTNSERAGRVKAYFAELDFKCEDYQKMSAPEREKSITALRTKRDDLNFKLQKGEQGYTHDALLRAAAEWKRKSRMAQVEVSELLSGATASDIELLLDVKATLYKRLSDEAMYEVKRIDEAVKYLGRSRYRKVAGIAEKVEGI